MSVVVGLKQGRGLGTLLRAPRSYCRRGLGRRQWKARRIFGGSPGSGWQRGERAADSGDARSSSSLT